MSAQVYSFDVFGTCLLRTFAQPTDLFYVLAESMLEEGGREPARVDVSEIAHLRIEGERIARSRSSRDDVSLAEIYESMEGLGQYGIRRKAMAEEELELESESVRPIAETRRRIDDLRSRGARVVFISDMYLPELAIREMLACHGFWRPGDGLYVSNSVGLAKWSGRLFEHVLSAEGVPPHALRHYGDDGRTDGDVPRRMGIQVPEMCTPRLTHHELAVLTEGEAESWVRSRIAGTSRAVRMSTDADSESAIVEMAADVAGPLLVTFVAWVLDSAQRQGIDRLYFVSRDGQVLLQIANVLSRYVAVPECRYLYGSRQAWLPGCVDLEDRATLDWITKGSTAPRHMLQKLMVDPADTTVALKDMDLNAEWLDRQLSGRDLERFWQLLERPDIRGRIQETTAFARERTCAYLRQEGVADEVKWAMVDIGWSLNLQWALRRLLAGMGLENRVQGYYLGVNAERRPRSQVGPYRAWLMPEDSDELVKRLWDRAMIIEEAFLMPDHGSVLGYGSGDGPVEPILGNWETDPTAEEYRRIERGVLMAYAEEIGKSDLLPKHLPALRTAALSSITRFVQNPTQAEAGAIAWIRCVADSTHERSLSFTLARRLTLRDVALRFVHRQLPDLSRSRGWTRKETDADWIEGSLALSSPLVRQLRELASRPGPRGWVRRLRRVLKRIAW